MGEWGSRVQEMWVDGTLSPKPIKQELEPIYKIFLTDAVKNIVHDDGIKKTFDWINVIQTALKHGYSEYCTIMKECYYPACPKKVVLDGDLYDMTEFDNQGRKIYEDYQNRNSLMYREGEYTNGWVVVPTNDLANVIKQTAPCPQVGGKFEQYETPSKLPKPLPSKDWKECSIKCQNYGKCNFWQYHEMDTDSECLLFEDYESIESTDATTDYYIGSKDCPGDDKGLMFLQN